MLFLKYHSQFFYVAYNTYLLIDGFRVQSRCDTYLFYFILIVGVVSSDVSRSSCTTSFMPGCPIICHSFPTMPLSVSWCYPGVSPSSAPRQNSENACLSKSTHYLLFLYMHVQRMPFFFPDNLGKEFASCLKFTQYAIVCPFLHQTYKPLSSVAPHFSCF